MYLCFYIIGRFSIFIVGFIFIYENTLLIIECMDKTTESAINKPEKKKYGNAGRIEKAGETISFADFVANGRVWIKLFREHLADFAALDPEFNAAFANDWEAANEALALFETDETQRDEIAYRTSELLKTHQPVLRLLDDLDYYTGKAFPTDPRKVDELGIKLMRRDAGSTQLKFVLWGYTALRVATDYQPQLTAAGLPLAWYTDFDTALGVCGEAELEQEYAKRQRIRKTTERVMQFNALHKTWQRVNKAAKVIYRTKPEMEKLWYWK